jgi:hypothetical protein
MSETTICPYCSAKLRVGSRVGRSTRVKCHVCKNRFHPTCVLTPGGQTLPLNQPLAPPVPGPDDSKQRSNDDSKRSRPDSVSPQAAESFDGDGLAKELPADPMHEPIDASVIDAAFPHHDPSRVASRERIKERVSRSSGRKLKVYEWFLAIGLLTAAALGAAYIALVFLRPQLESPEYREQPQSELPHRELARRAGILETEFSPKELPTRLMGTWERRSDDDIRGWIEYRGDSVARVQEWVGEEDSWPRETTWRLVKDLGDVMEIELAGERGMVSNQRYELVLTAPDAFTVTVSWKNGVRRAENVRFVKRRGTQSPGVETR